MSRPLLPVILLVLALPAAHGEDVLFLANGSQRTGKVLGLDARGFRLEVPLTLPAGAAAGATAPKATVTVPRADVSRIEFAPDARRDEFLKAATPAQIEVVAAYWQRTAPLLAIPRSPAARIGNVYADLLLRLEKPDPARALETFKRIEAETWSDEDRAIARQGRLRATIAAGDPAAAVAEAKELAASSEDPSVLIEAKFILGRAAEQNLRTLVEENPRWQEDVLVVPEHARLVNEALDHYLFAPLFHGADAAAAARGLAGAIAVYRFTGDTPLALETARDLVAFYPTDPAAKAAREYLDSLTQEQREQDYEKEARELLNPKPQS